MFNLVSVFLVLMSVWLIFQKQNTVSRIIMQNKNQKKTIVLRLLLTSDSK